MANKTVILEGTIEWPKLFESTRDLGGDDNDAARVVAAFGGRYNVNFYPDDPAAFEELCLNLCVPLKSMGHNLIKEKDGRRFFRPYRNHDPKITAKGVEIIGSGGPPKVMDDDGNAWDEEVSIGNGSSVKLAVETYPVRGDKSAFRLKGIRVVELVEYEAVEVDVTDALMA